nr:5' DNA nuclease [Xaviernesmea oryzae]
MTKKGEDRRDMEAADQHPAFDPTRLPYFSEALSLNPLLAHPAAAMAAATAIGFGFANQMASAFFGVLQGAMEAANQRNQPAGAEVSAPVEKPVTSRAAAVAEPVPPVAEKPKAKPVRKAAKPAAEKKVVAPADTAAKTKAAPKPAAGVSVKAPAGKVPARKPAKAKPAAKASAPAGDLKRISGIGPKLEGVLKGMGVTGLAEIAAWNDADIARFDKELGFEGRIRRDDWVGQAKALLK